MRDKTRALKRFVKVGEEVKQTMDNVSRLIHARIGEDFKDKLGKLADEWLLDTSK